MKILIFNWRDIKNPKAGGSEQYFHEIARRWVENGHKVSWISGGWKNCLKKEIINGIHVKRTGNELSLYLLSPLAYSKLKEKPDVIIDVENGLPFFTPLFSKDRKILHIHHIHKDVWFKEAEGKGLKEKIIALLGFVIETKFMPLVYKKIKVVSISKSSALEIEREKVGKIIGIVNPAFSVEKGKIKRTKFPSILLVNRIKKYKGIETLIRAFQKISERKEMKNAILYIAGTGDYLEIAKSITRTDRIKFLGKVSDKEKYDLMRKCWIFINPSFKEGWGIVNIEANYFGLPVIGSNVLGIKDSVINGKTGLLFEYGDEEDLARKMLLLVKNKKMRENFGKNGKKFSRNFSWEKSAEDYLKILKGVIKNENLG